MKLLRVILKFVALAAVLCLSSFAATEYVIVNNNNSVGNSAIMYKLDAAGPPGLAVFET
jgi:hypothetical protein